MRDALAVRGSQRRPAAMGGERELVEWREWARPGSQRRRPPPRLSEISTRDRVLGRARAQLLQSDIEFMADLLPRCTAQKTSGDRVALDRIAMR